ncbi:MAG: hypothetical protein WDK96_03690 [Candidatus Paceibacterota bacterium]|jgi:hypothetical protein
MVDHIVFSEDNVSTLKKIIRDKAPSVISQTMISNFFRLIDESCCLEKPVILTVVFDDDIRNLVKTKLLDDIFPESSVINSFIRSKGSEFLFSHRASRRVGYWVISLSPKKNDFEATHIF